MSQAHVVGFIVGAVVILAANYWFNFPSKKG